MAPLTRILITVFAVITAVIGAGVYLAVRDQKPTTTAEVSDVGQVIRENSHRLTTAPGSEITFVEFLDFECEGCRAAFPLVERLRTEYGDRVNFAIRYFPLPSHFNSDRAARAVEAAAQQDQLEAMYKKMYETQSTWGEQQTPADHVFRGFADELGLDMARFDAAYNSTATRDRIDLDVADGRALGLRGTPSFFLDGEQIQFQGYDDLTQAINRALTRRY